MKPPARPGAGLVGEVDVEKAYARSNAGGKKKGQKSEPVRLEFSDASLKDIIIVFRRNIARLCLQSRGFVQG